MSSFFYADSDAPRPNRPRRVGVVALIEDEGRLLLERRADIPVWSLIGGALENDETLLGALRREVQEETGLVIASYELLGTFSDPSRVAQYPDGNIFQLVTLAYRVEVEDIAAISVSSESLELRFFARHDLPTDELAAVARPIVARYLSKHTPPFLD